jgi:CubicO group peptidase (beta-lactamase class C family)
MIRTSRRSLFAAPLALTLGTSSTLSASALRQERPGNIPWPIPDWPETPPEAVNIDPTLPDALAAAAQAAPSITGAVVIRHGAIAAEYVADGWSRDEPADIRSCTKSVVAALVGTARREGLLPDLSVTIGDLIPDRIPANADSRIADIPLWGLLTMTAGIAWDWSSDYQRLEAADDPVAYTLNQPIAAEPGAVYAYNSGGSHLIGLMVAAAAGQPLEEYADEALFAPLDMEPGIWRLSPQGEAIGGYGLRLTPRDMARFGYLYLQDGVWDGEEIITPAYIEQSTIRQSSGDPTGGTPYGYQWWVSNATGYDAFYALGFGGQFIYVVPALDLIVVTAVGDITVPLFPPRPIIESSVIPLVYPD